MSAPGVVVVTLTAEALRALVREAAEEGARQALADAQADQWLDATAAAQHLYGQPGKLEAFHQLRRRRPELDSASVGLGKLRRWRRSALDALLAAGAIRLRETPAAEVKP